MKIENTRDQILEAALELFSVKGYEATSISQIADAVGIRKASLYSHFAGKQDILDTLIEVLEKQYEAHSIFTNADWEDSKFTKDKKKMTAKKMSDIIVGQIRFIIHDPDISRVRKLLVIEQFQNPALSRLQSKHSYGDILNYNLGQIKFLIREGILRDENPEIMAAQLAWPISIWTNLCDREPEREEEAMENVKKHVKQFFKLYKK